MKLWQKDSGFENSEHQKKIGDFTIGSDKHWDLLLASADVVGSIAHAKMLHKINLLSDDELTLLLDGLVEIQQIIDRGEFKINEDVEDVHSQIELLLTKSKGEVGKKIHSGRSRNDQSLVDIKLYLKSEVLTISKLVEHLFAQLISLSEKYKNDLMPGYTHLQLAMPSSFGMWFAAYAESLLDDLEVLITSYNVVNKNPLGSGAGYGSSFPLDREFTTELLGFESVNVNSIYAQMTRGKSEKIVSYALSSIAATLNKLSSDICLYLNQNFNFIKFPTELTTGSSIMPHKKNPDVFELIRAKCNKIQALPNELTLLLTNLPSGYHRDLQLTKESLFPSIKELKQCLSMMLFMLENIEINKNILEDPKYTFLFTVEEINKLVLNGIPFRDAYKKIANEVESGSFSSTKEINHTHVGSIGNLRNDLISSAFRKKMLHFSR